MNNETIENEIYDFVDEYFDEELSVTEANLDFIEDNRLLTPTKDYTFLYTYLSDILNKFKIIDPNFVSPIITKANDDIKSLNDIYNNFSDKTSNIKDVFNSNFIPNSLVIRDYAKSILNIKNSLDRSADDFVHLKHMKHNFVKLKETYYPVYEYIFFDNKKNIDSDFKNILNSKIFYFDRLIWKSAIESQSIVKHMKIRKMKGELSAKEYLNFIMSLMRPYTDEYKYLEKCLKVYK